MISLYSQSGGFPIKYIFPAILSAALLFAPGMALANHGHHGHGSHDCDSSKACPLGHKDCDGHKNCPLGKHDCGKKANMDADGDGKVSKKEFMAAKQARAEAKFKRKDVDGDGFITDKDREMRMSKRIDDFFAAADSDKNGSLSKEEYAAAKKAKCAKKKDCPLSKPKK